MKRAPSELLPITFSDLGGYRTIGSMQRVLVALVTVLLADVAWASSGEPSGDLLLRWSHQWSGRGEVDRGPTVEVFVDGAVVVDYPIYMKRAGRWAMRLSRRALDDLIDTVLAAGVMEFDERRVRERARAVTSQAGPGGRSELFDVFDAATTKLEVTLPRARAVRSRRVSGVPSAVSKSISWYALAATAARYPELVEIRDLARVERAMKALLRSPALERVAEIR